MSLLKDYPELRETTVGRELAKTAATNLKALRDAARAELVAVAKEREERLVPLAAQRDAAFEAMTAADATAKTKRGEWAKLTGAVMGLANTLEGREVCANRTIDENSHA